MGRTVYHVLLFVGENHVLPSPGNYRRNRYAVSYVSRMVSGCFSVLRQLRSIRRSVSNSVFQSLVVSFVMPCLDYT